MSGQPQGARHFKAQVEMTNKPHKLKIEYFEQSADAVLRFLWVRLDDPKDRPDQDEVKPVLAENLFH